MFLQHKNRVQKQNGKYTVLDICRITRSVSDPATDGCPENKTTDPPVVIEGKTNCELTVADGNECGNAVPFSHSDEDAVLRVIRQNHTGAVGEAHADQLREEAEPGSHVGLLGSRLGTSQDETDKLELRREGNGD